MTDEEDEDSGINITLGKLVSYPAGVILTVLGVLYMLTNAQLGGLLITVAGLFSLPVIRRRIADENGVSVNRWATVAIVLILVVAGFAFVPTGDNANTTNTANNGNTGSDGVTLITANATELLPTIDAFESGWQGGVNDDGTARYFNVENENSLSYNVTVFDSVDAAEAALQEREPEQRATSDVSIGDGGFKYPITDSVYRIQFRERNVICETYFSGGFGAESAADRMAEKCEAAINE